MILLLMPQTQPVQAQQTNRSDQKNAQTINMLSAIDQGKWDTARKLAAQTNDPLASKLYQWFILNNNQTPENYIRLVQFIRYNPAWPKSGALRMKAERNMPENLPAPDVIAWFDDYPPVTKSGTVLYINALLSRGKKAKATHMIQSWWGEKPMSRAEQQDFYRRYASHLNQKSHMRRFDMLLLSGAYTNARAIANVLGGGYPALAEARIALHSKKGDVNTLINAVPRNLQNDPGLLYERLKWRRQNNMDVGAMEILHTAPPMSGVANASEWWRERHIIIRRLLENKQYESAYLLARNHKQEGGFPYAQAEFIAGWLALNFLNKPTDALLHFEALRAKVETPISVARAAYWSGLAAKKMGAVPLSQKWFNQAAQYQTVFYGQLAGAELGIKGTLPNAAPPVISLSEKNIFEQNDLIRAARLLHAARMDEEAGLFIAAFINQDKTAKRYRFAAELSSDLKMYERAVRTAKDATAKGLFLTAQSYPVITEQLRGIPVEWALIHGLIRQESMFDINARSPVGARGLMQLMPATATETARKIGIPHNQSWLTQRPAHNIKLGSTYMQKMLNRYNGYYPMAIAAYNAGPTRVDRWIVTFGDPRKGEIAHIDWMELIPIYETRNYVQRVMETIYVYRLRLQNVQEVPRTPIHISYVQ